MEKFQFDVVAYDELEEFNKNIKHDNFTYPYTENKIIVDTLRPKFDSRSNKIHDIYLQKSQICLETPL